MNDVTIICYGKAEKMPRAKALKFYKDCARACEGAERERYTNIVLDLMEGWNLCTDGDSDWLPKGYHKCKYCGGVAEGDYDDLLCEKCREDFGHSLYSEL